MILTWKWFRSEEPYLNLIGKLHFFVKIYLLSAAYSMCTYWTPSTASIVLRQKKTTDHVSSTATSAPYQMKGSKNSECSHILRKKPIYFNYSMKHNTVETGISFLLSCIPHSPHQTAVQYEIFDSNKCCLTERHTCLNMKIITFFQNDLLLRYPFLIQIPIQWCCIAAVKEVRGRFSTSPSYSTCSRVKVPLSVVNCPNCSLNIAFPYCNQKSEKGHIDIRLLK